LAKIAVELERALVRRAVSGASGEPAARILAEGDGWSVSDVVCTSGPQDRPFEERHERVCIAMVAAGSFQYRSPAGRDLMTPGSLMLGSPGQCFECGHEHGRGDRCISFQYTAEYFERLAADAGAVKPHFGVSRVPPLREASPLLARACAGLDGSTSLSWEEMGVRLAVSALRLSRGLSVGPGNVPPNAEARVTEIIRRIERHPDDALTLAGMAGEAGLSAYYFLRTFECLTGVTPHQYVLRTRLREAAIRLAEEPARVGEIAFDCGFGDVSNFNHAFRAEFGVSPRAYRAEFGVSPRAYRLQLPEKS
jgi:AraC-like DNA-binding protein